MMNERETKMTRTEALSLVAIGQFRAFDKADYQTFAGVQSDDPMIAEVKFLNKDYVIIVDGDLIQFITEDGSFESFVINFL